jgi:hypothetical protein
MRKAKKKAKKMKKTAGRIKFHPDMAKQQEEIEKEVERKKQKEKDE